MILKQIDQIDQWAQNNITLIYANASAIANNITTIAESNATVIEYQGYSNAYAYLDSYINFGKNDSAFLSFMFAETASKFTNKTNINFGFTSPAVLIDNTKV